MGTNYLRLIVFNDVSKTAKDHTLTLIFYKLTFNIQRNNMLVTYNGEDRTTAFSFMND